MLAEMEALDREEKKKRKLKQKNGKAAHKPKGMKTDPKKKTEGRKKNGTK